MRRRILLRAAALGGAGLLAGCTGDPSPNIGRGNDSSTDSASESSTDAPSETPTASPSSGDSGVDGSFTVTNIDCGTGEDSADISVCGDTVTVGGVASASDPCRTARLVDERTTVSNDTLHVAVETYVPPENEDEVCAQCLADVDYEATFTFGGALPDRVEVSHNEAPVADADL
jgi:hypothetical protein